MALRNHKELRVWQRSFKLATDIYRTTARYPKSELYGLTSQTRRCAAGIPANIAEGFARKTRKEFLQFLYIALGSGAELETHLLISKELGYAEDEEVNRLLAELDEIMRMTNALIQKLKH